MTTILKTITLTPVEFVSFKELAQFFFDIKVKNGYVHVTANSIKLSKLGY